MKALPPRSDPHPSLVARAQAGDRDALTNLLREVTPPVQQWARAICRDPQDAEDLTQDVLILLVRKLPTFDGRSRFLTWLYSVTRNQGLDALRKRHREERKMEYLETRFLRQTEPHPPPDLSPDEERIRELVRTFLEELPPRQREVFQMADLQGLTPKEISRILGMRPGGVRAALHKARRTLREHILRGHGELAEEYLP